MQGLLELFVGLDRQEARVRAVEERDDVREAGRAGEFVVVETVDQRILRLALKSTAQPRAVLLIGDVGVPLPEDQLAAREAPT